jgi:2-hydroxy-3-oxopropionate reductase
MAKIGFIGLGAMGAPMARRLVAAGHAVATWNRSPKTIDGADAAASPAALTRACDIVIVCVSDTAAVEQVVFGDNGVAQGAAAGKLFVDHSTIHPLATRTFAEKLRASGMAWVDAPVSGGVTGATDGALIVMAGGATDDVSRAEPIIASYAKRITHLGPNGAGQAGKVCNQLLIGAAVAAAAEALTFAARFGVQAARIPDALAGGWADSTVLQRHARMMAAGEPDNIDGRLMQKDMDIACDMGRATGTPMPIATSVAELYRLMIAQGHAAAGQIGLMKLYEKPRSP